MAKAKGKKTSNQAAAPAAGTLQAELARLGQSITILTDCCEGNMAAEYGRRRQVFNTKFQFRPTAIFMVAHTKDVAAIVSVAASFPDQVRLRAKAGGHDHEGECSGTDTWVVDFANMNQISKVDDWAGQKRDVVKIGAGARFWQVKQAMDEMGLAIAHGTCATVSPTGYTMGGGWGPWTRRYGMGCERLIGATLVKGNGEVVELRDTDPPDSDHGRLLWALRGGGGFSWGIVTALYFHAFALPAEAHSFHVSFIGPDGLPDRSAISVLKDWERMVAGEHNPDLTGTNLMIVGTHLEQDCAPDPEARLRCVMNGYFAGTEQQIRELVAKGFGPHYPVQIRRHTKLTKGKHKTDPAWHFHPWDRGWGHTGLRSKGVIKGRSETTIDPAIELETEGPAPHKITSRLAEPGWSDESRRALICSLQSPLIPPFDPAQANDPVSVSGPYGVQCYITIGAITGPYYASKTGRESARSVAFPYTRRPFTLQFQAWWDQYFGFDSKTGEFRPLTTPEVMARVSLNNRPWTNRAEDWIEACRDAHIPHSSGAFISFKDDAVKTATYFAQHYDDLKQVKRELSDDPNLLFQTRKTIL